MNKFFALLRAGLKSNFGLSVLRHSLFKERKDLWLVPLVALSLFGLGPLFYGYVKLMKMLYNVLQPLGQQYALLTFGFLAGQVFILIFGLYYVISAFYFSKDLEILVPLPLRPFQVMLSKFAIILTNEYLTTAPLILPLLIYFGIRAKAGPGYWIEAVIIYLLLPVIPLAIASLLVIVLMRAVNLGRKKDALIIVGSLVLIVLAMGLQFWLGQTGNNNLDPQAMVSFLASPDSLLNRVGARFPPSIWATKALAGGLSATGLGNLLLFAGTSLILLFGIVSAAEALFYRGLIGLGEAARRGKVLSRADMSRKVSTGRQPVRAIFRREWRIMNRTPIFLLNGVLTVIIIPVIFLLLAKTGSPNSDTTFLLGVIASGRAFIVVLASACFMTICGALNGTASSTFSREGSQFWMSKVIPVSPREQVTAKFLHSYLIALLGIVVGSGVLIWQFQLKLAVYVPALLLALAAAFNLTAVGIAIDLARPLLDWTNPQKAIKQNLNVLFAFLADLGLLALLGFLCFGLGKMGVRGRGILAILLLVLVGLDAASFWFLVKLADKRYQEIEV